MTPMQTPAPSSANRRQIRGSSLLLVGKVISTGINFAAQVLIIRHLSTGDYGSFAFALSVVTFSNAFSTLGLQSSIPRFVPIYHENHEYSKIFGTLVLVLGVTAIGVILVLLAVSFTPEAFLLKYVGDHQGIALLYTVAFLIPVQSLDNLIGSLFASLASPKTIFFRVHVLSPGLKLAVALLLVILHSGVWFLALGYVVASALGLVVYVVVLVGILRHRGLLADFHLANIVVPAREMFAFSIPVLTSDLVTVASLSAMAVLLLAHWHSGPQVAYFRAVLPAASLNIAVTGSFSLLFTPMAARMFAHQNYAGINDLYWKTTLWMTLLSYPAFLLTFSMSAPVTVLFFGHRYLPAAGALAALSLGNFFNVALGLNGQTLRVFGAVRFLVVTNAISVVAGGILTLLLVPKYSAFGAAVGVSATIILRNVLTQAGFSSQPHLKAADRRYIHLYAFIVLSAFAVLGVQHWFHLRTVASLVVCVLATVLVFAGFGRHLDLAENFPELLKVPLFRWLLRWLAAVNEWTGRLFGSSRLAASNRPAVPAPMEIEKPLFVPRESALHENQSPN